MLNVGFNPTINKKHKLSIEVNIFDFNQQIYNEYITVEFIKRVRKEKKFQNASQLQEQLNLDKITILNILS